MIWRIWSDQVIWFLYLGGKTWLYQTMRTSYSSSYNYSAKCPLNGCKTWLRRTWNVLKLLQCWLISASACVRMCVCTLTLPVEVHRVQVGGQSGGSCSHSCVPITESTAACSAAWSLPPGCSDSILSRVTQNITRSSNPKCAILGRIWKVSLR